MLRGSGSLVDWTDGHAEALVAGAAVWRPLVSDRRPEERRRVIAAATVDPRGKERHVRTPFSHIGMHVEQAPRITPLRPTLLYLLSFEYSIVSQIVVIVATRINRRRAGTTSIYTFVYRRQTVPIGSRTWTTWEIRYR